MASTQKKIIVSIGLTDEKNDTLKQHLNLDGSDIFKIIAEPDLASAQARSLANFDVACVVLYINSAASVKSVSQLRLNYQDSFPTLGWMDEFHLEFYLECIEAGMQDAITPETLASGKIQTQIIASCARLSYQRGEKADSNYLNQLLERTTDTIYFKDSDSRFLRVSKSMVKLFSCDNEKQLIGKTDLDFQADEHARSAYHDEQKLMRTGEEIIGKIEHQILKDGTESWIQTSRLVLRNEKGETIGTMGISRDVTELFLSRKPINNKEQLLSGIINSLDEDVYAQPRLK